MFDNIANPGLIPIQMCSSIEVVDQFAPDFTLAQENATQNPRTFVKRIMFETPFSSIPVVHAALAGLDVDQRDSARLSIRAEAITADGFDLHITTWENTRVYKVEVSWIALG